MCTQQSNTRPIVTGNPPKVGNTKKTSPVRLFVTLRYKTCPVCIFDSLWLYNEDLSCVPLRFSLAVQRRPLLYSSRFSLAVQRRPLLYSSRFSLAVQRRPLLYSSRFSLAVQRRPLLYSPSILFVCTKSTCPVLLLDSLWLYKEDLSWTPLRFSLAVQKDLYCMPLRFSLVYKEDLSCLRGLIE